MNILYGMALSMLCTLALRADTTLDLLALGQSLQLVKMKYEEASLVAWARYKDTVSQETRFLGGRYRNLQQAWDSVIVAVDAVTEAVKAEEEAPQLNRKIAAHEGQQKLLHSKIRQMEQRLEWLKNPHTTKGATVRALSFIFEVPANPQDEIRRLVADLQKLKIQYDQADQEGRRLSEDYKRAIEKSNQKKDLVEQKSTRLKKAWILWSEYAESLTKSRSKLKDEWDKGGLGRSDGDKAWHYDLIIDPVQKQFEDATKQWEKASRTTRPKTAGAMLSENMPTHIEIPEHFKETHGKDDDTDVPESEWRD